MKTGQKVDVHTLQRLNAEAAMTSTTIPTKKLLPPLHPKMVNNKSLNNQFDEKETEESDVRYYLELSTTDYDNLDSSPLPLPSSLKPTKLLKNQPQFRHLLNTPVISIISENTTNTTNTPNTSTKSTLDTLNPSKALKSLTKESLPPVESKSAELDQLGQLNQIRELSKSLEDMGIGINTTNTLENSQGLSKTLSSTTNQRYDNIFDDSMVTRSNSGVVSGGLKSNVNVPIPTITPPYPSKKAVILRWDGTYDEIDYVTHLPESQNTSMIELILGSSPQVIGDLESLNAGADGVNGDVDGMECKTNNSNDKMVNDINDNVSDNSDDSDIIEEDNSEEIVEMQGDKYTLHLVCRNQEFGSSGNDNNNDNYSGIGIININNYRLNRHSLPFPFNRETIRGDILVYKTKNDEFGTNGNNIIDLTIDEYLMFLTEQTMLASDIMFGKDILTDNNNNNPSKSMINKINTEAASSILNNIINNNNNTTTNNNKYDDIDISILSSDDEKNARLQEISPMKYNKLLGQTDIPTGNGNDQTSGTVNIIDVTDDCTVKTTARRTLITPNPSENILSSTTVRETIDGDGGLAASRTAVTAQSGYTTTDKLSKNTKTERETLLVLKSAKVDDMATIDANGVNNNNNGTRKSVEQSPDKVMTSFTSENGDFRNGNKIQFIGGINGVMTDIIDISDIVLEFDDVSSAPEEIIINQNDNSSIMSENIKNNNDATVVALLDDIILNVCKEMKSFNNNNNIKNSNNNKGLHDVTSSTNIITVEDLAKSTEEIDTRLKELDLNISQFEKDYMDALAYTRLIAAAKGVSEDMRDNGVDSDDDVDTDRSDEKLESKVDNYYDNGHKSAKLLDGREHDITEMKDLQSEELIGNMNDDDNGDDELDMDIMPLDINETRKEISDILSKIEMKVDDKIRQALELGESKKESDIVNDVCKDVSYIHSIVKQSYKQILSGNGNNVDRNVTNVKKVMKGDMGDVDQGSEYSDDFETESVTSDKKEESLDVSEVITPVHSIGVSTATISNTNNDNDDDGVVYGNGGNKGFMERKSNDGDRKINIFEQSKDFVKSNITETKLQQIYHGIFEKDINIDELETLMMMVKKV